MVDGPGRPEVLRDRRRDDPARRDHEIEIVGLVQGYRGLAKQKSALAVVFKPAESARTRLRAVNAPRLVAPVRARSPLRTRLSSRTPEAHAT